MKSKLIVATILSAALLLAVSLALAQTTQEYSGTKWSYVTLVYDAESHQGAVLSSDLADVLEVNLDMLGSVPPEMVGAEIAHYLDYVGNMGYELVSVEPSINEENKLWYTFKRPIQ